jgi:hypothetical protein
MAAKGAVRPALAVHLQNPVAGMCQPF